MNTRSWERRNESYLGEIARDDDLGDEAYIEVLEDIIDRASAMKDAKEQEMED